MTTKGNSSLLALAVVVLLAGLATPAHATFPGKNGRIAFIMGPDLYTMKSDGSDVKQLTSLGNTGTVSWEGWSADGNQIVFDVVAPNNGPGALWLMIVFARESPLTQQIVVTTMRPDGTHKTELTSNFWGVFRSAFTPDEKHIVWETQQAGFFSVLWIMRSTGSHQRRLTPAGIKAGDVAVSPDGEHIAFNSNQNSPLSLQNSIFVMNVNGTGITQLTHPGGAHHDVFPNYSPDGTKIVFASDRMNSMLNYDLFTMNADGSNITRIATGLTVGGCTDGNCVSPAWGPKP